MAMGRKCWREQQEQLFYASEQAEASLVAPLALYPDPLLAQTLAASTYPLEIVQLWQWMGKHKDLKNKALADAVQRENWDISVQAMAAFPDVVKRLAENLQWTSELGNAFLAQQSDIMEAVQRMRMKAMDTGNLKSSEQQLVQTKVVESKTVVVIEPAKPNVVYVPIYDPVAIYGAPLYPYPLIYYPPPGAYAAGMAISFGVGMAMGAAMGGGWGWNCGWGGHNNINVNINNNFINNSRTNVGNKVGGGGNRVSVGNTWQHNPQHRGGAPYGDRATANRFGGTVRGDSLSSRQENARQNQRQVGRGRQSAASGRTSGMAGTLGSDRRPSVSTSSMGSNRGLMGGDRVGDRQVSSVGSRGSSAFGGSGGDGGRSARSSSSRGASSMRSGSGSGHDGGRRR